MHLIVQGPEIETTDLKHLAKLSGATSIERVTPEAFRLRDAHPAEGIAETCARAGIDHACVPEDRRLADYRLLVLDMDSTLITIEAIDELADFAGCKPQVAAITAQAMRGEIEYDDSLRRRVALLAGLDETALARVYDERLTLSPGAQTLLAAARNAGIKTLLVSGGFTYFTERLKERLGLDYTRSNTLGIDRGKLSGEVLGPLVNARAKRDEVRQAQDALGISGQEIIAVGDGANDLEFMAEAGVSVAYRAKPVVREKALHTINHVGLDGVLHLFN